MKTESKAGAAGAVGGAGAAVGTTAVVFAGKSAAAIAYTLGTIGGTMVGGIAVVAAAPIVAAGVVGGAAYGITKMIKKNKQKK